MAYRPMLGREVASLSPTGIAIAAAALTATRRAGTDVSEDDFWRWFDRIGMTVRKTRREMQGRRAWQAQADKLRGLPKRIYKTIEEEYCGGTLTIEIDDLDDEELLAIEGIGPGSVAKIRATLEQYREWQSKSEVV